MSRYLGLAAFLLMLAGGPVLAAGQSAGLAGHVAVSAQPLHLAASAPSDDEGGSFLGGDEPIYLRMEGLTAPIMRGNHVRHYIFLNINLEMVDSSARDDAAALKPRLHDAFLTEFYSKSIGKGDGLIDFGAVKARLLRQARKVLGDNKVKDILITRAMRGAG